MRQYKTFSRSKLAVRCAGGLLVIAAIIAGLELTNTTHLFHKASLPTSNSQYTKGEPAGGNAGRNTSSAQSGNSSETNSQKSAAGSSPTATLLDPSGSFVSNHHPNLGGSPAPNTLTSVCSTTPGATCSISFTKDGVTKSLPAQTVDSGGSTYWNNWSLQSIGLTSGSWQIKATATLGGQTRTASDAMNLEVGS